MDSVPRESAAPPAAGNLAPGRFFGRVERSWRTDLVNLSVVTHDDAHAVPVHSHEHLFFSLLLRGAYQEFVTDRTFRYGPLTVVYHPEHLTHSDEIGAGGAQFFIVEVSPAMLGRSHERPSALHSVRDLSGGAAVWRMVRLYREVLTGHVLPVSLEEQAAELVEEVGGADDEHPRQPPAWLADTRNLIEERYREPLTLGEVADRAGVHPVYLSRVFRHFHRQPIRAVVHQLRVQHACRLLSAGETSLVKIALESGFVDQSHLTHVFRRVTGMTPGALRSLLTRRTDAAND